MAYPLETIVSLLEFVEIFEANKELTTDGEMAYSVLPDVLTHPVFIITYDDVLNENIILLIEPGRVAPFSPHESWEDLMFLLPLIHNQIHTYQNASTDAVQRHTTNYFHNFILSIEKNITVSYSKTECWNNLVKLESALYAIKIYFPTLNNSSNGTTGDGQQSNEPIQ